MTRKNVLTDNLILIAIECMSVAFLEVIVDNLSIGYFES